MAASSSPATEPDASSAALPVSTIEPLRVMMSTPRVWRSIVAKASK